MCTCVCGLERKFISKVQQICKTNVEILQKTGCKFVYSYFCFLFAPVNLKNDLEQCQQMADLAVKSISHGVHSTLTWRPGKKKQKQQGGQCFPSPRYITIWSFVLECIILVNPIILSSKNMSRCAFFYYFFYQTDTALYTLQRSDLNLPQVFLDVSQQLVMCVNYSVSYRECD